MTFHRINNMSGKALDRMTVDVLSDLTGSAKPETTLVSKKRHQPQLGGVPGGGGGGAPPGGGPR